MQAISKLYDAVLIQFDAITELIKYINALLKNYIYLIEKKKQEINNEVQDLNKKTEYEEME